MRQTKATARKRLANYHRSVAINDKISKLRVKTFPLRDKIADIELEIGRLKRELETLATDSYPELAPGGRGEMSGD